MARLYGEEGNVGMEYLKVTESRAQGGGIAEEAENFSVTKTVYLSLSGSHIYFACFC